MGFTNPATQLTPFYRFRDEFFWPSISGEQFAPTSTGPGYQEFNGRPCYGASSGFTPGTITFPNMPRVSAISGNRTMIIDFWLASVAVSSGLSFVQFGANRPQVQLGNNGGGANYLLWSIDLAGTVRSIDTHIPMPSDPAHGWDHITFTIFPAGAMTLDINGVIGANETHLVWPFDVVTGLINTSSFTAVLFTPYMVLSQMRVSWV